MNKAGNTVKNETSDENSLLPCDVRPKTHIPGKTLNKIGVDQSGEVTYSFNRAGYRGEDFDPSAKLKICLIGESHAFGIGVDYSVTYGNKFKQHVAKALGEDEADINLINLAVGGSSADYCVRTLYRQISLIDVDLVICHIPSRDRIEYLGGKHPVSYQVAGANADKLEEMSTPLLGYLDFYSPKVGLVNQIKNALMVQDFLKRQKAGYILLTGDMVRENTRLKLARPFAGQLDFRHVLRHSFFRQRADFATDNRHAGARSHAAVAIALVNHYSRVLADQGDNNRANQIESYANTLMATDKDWAFCNEFVARESAGTD